MPTTVCFAYRFANRAVGSTQMRVFQTIAALRRVAPGMQLRAWPLPDRAWPALQRTAARAMPRCDILVLSKTALRGTTPDALAILRDRCTVLIADHVDRSLDLVDPALPVDWHVACSRAAQRALGAILSGQGARVALVDHAHDLAVRPAVAPGPAQALYLGNPVYLPQMRDDPRVTVLPANNARQMRRALRQLGRYPLHLALRAPPDPQVLHRPFKPFTKGATAAAAGAVVLFNRGTEDAAALLGDDYPFVLPGLDPGQIAAGLDHALGAIGTPLWAEAQERMQALAAQTAPGAVARQWLALFERALATGP